MQSERTRVRKILMIAIAASGLALAPAMAQSTVELDSFSLDDDKPAPKPPAAQQTDSAIETCLFNKNKCADRELKSGAGFSFDDVVNLGIVDRSEVDTTALKPKVAPAKPGVTTAKQPPTAAIAIRDSEPLPSIDMEILFDYDSDLLRPDQYGRLTEVAALLRKDRFRNYRFALIGHTDAKGSAAYNTDLSLKRAGSVARFLRNQSGLNDSRFVTAGLGFRQLKTPTDPFSSANRRVQLVLIPVK